MSTFGYRESVLFTHAEKALNEKDDYTTSMMAALLQQSATLTLALQRLPLQIDTLTDIARLLVQRLRAGQKVLVAGNGGSAAQAQHFAAELVGRFKRERAPYPVLALTTDSAILTAIANDYGFQDVFVRQLQAFGQEGDLFLAFSTSGESENLVRAAIAGKHRGMAVAAILGERPCRLERLADVSISVPSIDTTAIQELHMVVTHLLCDIVEARLSAEECAQASARREECS
jgi:D-sedoheptulose 7-phosphate isomerase